MRIFSLANQLRLFLLILIGLCFPASAAPFLPGDVFLEYNLTVRGHKAGVTTVEISKLSQRKYNIEIIVIPNNFAAMLGAKKSDEKISLTFSEIGWKVLDYTQQRRGKKQGSTRVTPTSTGYSLSLDKQKLASVKNILIESELFPIGAIFFEKNTLDNRAISLIHRKNFSSAKYVFQSNEDITIDKVDYKTSYWKRMHPDNPKIWMDIWVEINTHIPLRIRRTKSGKQTTLAIKR